MALVLPRFRAGTVPGAADLQSISEALRGACAETRGAILAASVLPSGRALRRDRARPIWATLSGSSSPYSFAQTLDIAGNSLAPGPRAGSSNAWEVNGVSGLGGQVARLWPDRFGGWRFQWVVGGAAPVCSIGSCGLSSADLTVTGNATQSPMTLALAGGICAPGGPAASDHAWGSEVISTGSGYRAFSFTCDGGYGSLQVWVGTQYPPGAPISWTPSGATSFSAASCSPLLLVYPNSSDPSETITQ